MTYCPKLSDFAARLHGFIQRNSPVDTEFNTLAVSLFALQFEHNAAYRRFCQARGIAPEKVRDWMEIPAMPTVGFKELELTSLPVEERDRVFHSSGTTGQEPSRHYHSAESLSLYEASLLPQFKKHLLNERSADLKFLSLTPPPEEAPHSSLVHMFETVQHQFGPENFIFAGKIESDRGWTLDVEKASSGLREAVAKSKPVCILGTAFNFVHLLDGLGAETLHLPAGSRVMETGGYKGRSRTMSKTELHALIARRLGIPASHIVCEYGMSELSSQAYDAVVGDEGARLFRFPPWARALMVSPETGKEVSEGETGLIRIYDLANVWSVMAVQTEDLGVRRSGGFELLGRAASAEPRGCSLMSLPAIA